MLLQQIAEDSQNQIKLQMILESGLEELCSQIQSIPVSETEMNGDFPVKICPSVFWERNRHVSIADFLL